MRGWDEVRAIEARFLQSLTVQESARQFLALYHTYLQETKPLFAPEREAYLVEIQERLQRLAEWQKEQGEKSI